MPSADVARNAHVRQALTAALPGARVTVRNGPNRTVLLTWSDGSTPNQVLAAAPDRFPGGRHARNTLRREVSLELQVIDVLRRYPKERVRDDRVHYAEGSTLPSAVAIDAATITPTERAQAARVAALAANHPLWGEAPHQAHHAVAITARTHRDTVTTATC